MKKAAVLGAGMVGSAIAVDLSGDYDVTAVDVDVEKLQSLKSRFNLNVKQCDVSNSGLLKEIIKDYDIVIGAVPGCMGFATLKTIIESGKNVVDISFFEEDPFVLDELAKSNNVTAVVDCGVAPGLSNIVLGMHNSKMELQSFECMVGGLPFKRTLPFQYKVPFSPSDVIEEYIRPARLIENGRLVIKPALSDPELYNVDPVGTLEAFNTDGLRTLLKTMRIPNMKEKTLRYPGHAEYINFLRDAGFFGKEEIEVDGKKVRPLDVASKILLPQWKLEPGEKEFTAMIIKIKGKLNGSEKEFTYKLFDTFDEVKGISSMARTTGYSCSSVARLVLNNDFNRKGISPPEFVGSDENCYCKIMDDLKERGLILHQTESLDTCG